MIVLEEGVQCLRQRCLADILRMDLTVQMAGSQQWVDGCSERVADIPLACIPTGHQTADMSRQLAVRLV